MLTMQSKQGPLFAYLVSSVTDNVKSWGDQALVRAMVSRMERVILCDKVILITGHQGPDWVERPGEVQGLGALLWVMEMEIGNVQLIGSK